MRLSLRRPGSWNTSLRCRPLPVQYTMTAFWNESNVILARPLGVT